MSEYEIQANEFAKKYGVKLYSKYLDYTKHPLWTDNMFMYHWKCVLKRGHSSYTFDFWQGLGLGCRKPDMYDILSCLMKYDVGDLDNFCSEFGYEITNVFQYHKVSRIHRGCQKEYKAVMRLFSDCIEELREIC